MSEGRRSTPQRPCPVCADTKARCLVHDEGGEISRVLCMQVEGPHSALLGSSWVWGSTITGGPGGSLVFPAAPIATAAPRRRKKPKIAQQLEESPSAEEQAEALQESVRRRHAGFLALLQGLPGFDEQTRDYIRRNRLLTAGQLDLLERHFHLRSIRRNQRLRQAAGLPGFDDEGRYLGKSGILIPAIGRDYNGQEVIVGFQVAVAPEELIAGCPKYINLSRGESEAKRDENYLRTTAIGKGGKKVAEELLYSCVPPDEKPTEAILTDSSLKAYVTALRQGVAGFGAPGMQYANRYNQLRANLEATVGLGGKVLIALDSGDGGNQQILAQALNVHQQLLRDGFDARFWVESDETFLKKASGSDIDDTKHLRKAGQVKTAEEVLKLVPASVRAEATRISAVLRQPGMRPLEPEDVLELPYLEGEKVETYAPGKRTEEIQKRLEAGQRAILLKDGTGKGKSHWAMSLADSGDLELLGFKQVLVLTPAPYDAVPHFQDRGVNVTLLRGRNAGVKRDRHGVRRVMRHPEDLEEGEVQLAEPNCLKLEALNRYQERNAGPLIEGMCGDCEHRELCEIAEGMFRADRAEALDSQAVAMHHNSLVETFLIPNENEETGLNETLIVADDLTVDQFFNELSVPSTTVSQHLGFFTRSKSKAVHQLLLWLTGLLASGRQITSDELRRSFEDGVGADGLRYLSWKAVLEEELAFVNRQPESAAPRCWLEMLKRWLVGEAAAWIDATGLHFKVRNEKLIRAMKTAGATIIADATGSALTIQKVLGLKEPPPVLQQQQTADTARHLRRQITGVGNLGFRRNPTERFLLQLVLRHLAEEGELDPATSALVEVKAEQEYLEDLADVVLTWFGSSRGSNRAETCKELVLIGTPNTNLSSAGSDFELIFGRSVDTTAVQTAVYPVIQSNGKKAMVVERKGTIDPEYRRYYAHLLSSAYLQGYGRLRTSIRLDEPDLRITAITDANLPFPVELVTYQELLGEEKMELIKKCNNSSLRSAAKDLAEVGQDPTTAAIAAHLEIPVAMVELWFSCQRKQPRWVQTSRLDARRVRAGQKAAPAATSRKPAPTAEVSATIQTAALRTAR